MLFEYEGRLHAVEIKSGATFPRRGCRPCQRWQRYAGEAAAAPVLVCGERDSYMVNRVHVMAWHKLGG